MYNNKNRARMVPEDILLKTHEGASNTIWGIITKALPKGMNGRVDVILNNPEHTVFFKDKDGKVINGNVKGFLSLPLKKEKGGIYAEKVWKNKLFNWVKGNAPESITSNMEESVNESVVNERNTSVSKRRAGAELKQKLKGKRSDGMGKYTATIYGLDSKGKRVELKSLNDLNKYSKFELDESINEGKKKLPKFKNIPSWARYVAQHSDGEWTWYEETPTMIKFRDGSGGAWKQDGNQTYTGVKTDGKDWDKMPTYYNVKNGKITESINEVKEPEVITQLRKIVKDKQNALVVDTKSKKKVRVDMQSASLMVQVYDALKQQSNKDKFVKSGIVMMGHTAYKLMKNESVNEAKAFVVMFKDKKDLPNRNVKPSSAAYSKEVDAKKFLKSVEKDGGKGMIVKSNVSGMKVEAKDTEVYHKSYTHAIEAAQAYALKKGYTIEDDEMFTKVGMNSKRPSVGKTTKVNLELLRKGKPQKKMLHIQVYGMKNGYELNAYIN
jgi:hypothetical protein